MPETVVTDDVLNQFIEGGTQISPYFTVNGSTNYVMDNGTYYSVNSTTATAWNFSNPFQVSSSVLSRFTAGSALTDNVSAGGTSYDIISGQSYGTTNSAILALWGVGTTDPVSQTLVDYIPSGGSLSQFARSSNPSDLRIFAVDGSNLYTLQNIDQALSYGITSQINPVVIPASSLSNYTIKNASQLIANGSNYYVMDAGDIRHFASTTVQNDFAPAGSSDFLQVSSNFINTYPVGGVVGPAIKGTPPAVYAMVNGQEELLDGPQFIANYGSTFTTVSDWLVANLPQGPAY
jgi:hypothetical protein